MCKNHRIHCSINTLKNSINRITEFIVVFKKIGKCYCMRFFFVGYSFKAIYIVISIGPFRNKTKQSKTSNSVSLSKTTARLERTKQR